VIPVEKSVSVIREVLSESRADFTIQVFDGDDHGMFRSSGGLDPRYLNAMRTWLDQRVARSPGGSR
jgi:hypothetical protein